MNNLIEHMPAIVLRAAQLNCTVIGVLDNVILCHRGDNTFITWRVGIYEAGIDFVSGCYDMTQGAGNKNLIARALGEQPVINTYQVWSPDHVMMTAEGSGNAETHAELVAIEESTGYSYSSVVTTDDIDSIVNAVQNEFNGDLQYHLMESA